MYICKHTVTCIQLYVNYRHIEHGLGGLAAYSSASNVASIGLSRSAATVSNNTSNNGSSSSSSSSSSSRSTSDNNSNLGGLAAYAENN